MSEQNADPSTIDSQDETFGPVASTSPAGMGRRVFGGLIGMAVGILALSVVQGISSAMYPMPEGLDLATEEGIQRLREFIATLPLPALLMVLLAHAVGAFSSGLACAMLVRSGWRIPVIVCGVLFTLAGILNLVQIPHPAWFGVIDTFLYLPSAWCGGLVASQLLPGCKP